MKTGDRVVCIKTKTSRQGNHKIVKDRIYMIHNVFSCQCGMLHLDIGFSNISPMGRCNCGDLYFTEGTLWAHSIYFAPLQYNSAHDELINIVEEKIDVKQPEKVEI